MEILDHVYQRIRVILIIQYPFKTETVNLRVCSFRVMNAAQLKQQDNGGQVGPWFGI